MSDLLRKPIATHGKIHDLTVEAARGPLSPDWAYVGFSAHRLKPGDMASEATGDREAILVLVQGKAEISVDGTSFGELGDRMNVFERTPPHCVYVPNAADWQVEATTDCVIGVCTAQS